MRFRVEQAGRLSAVVYTSLSLLAAATFLAVTILTGSYTWVARGGGAAWVFLLSMIILMPTLTPWLRRRLGKANQPRIAAEAGLPSGTAAIRRRS